MQPLLTAWCLYQVFYTNIKLHILNLQLNVGFRDAGDLISILHCLASPVLLSAVTCVFPHWCLCVSLFDISSTELKCADPQHAAVYDWLTIALFYYSVSLSHMK